MRSHRFYVPNSLEENSSFELPTNAAHHCIQVLRYKKGDTLTVFNGDGFDYSAKIDVIEKKKCRVFISNKSDPNSESPLRIHLLQGIAKGDKMDLIIQKAVELGVNEITPVFTERCNVKFDKKREEKKTLHWQKKIISACEQSGRARLVKLNIPINIEDIPRTSSPSIYLEPTASRTLSSLEISESIRCLIGPEGGLSESDLGRLRDLEFQGIKIGSRILRTETAGLTAISVLQHCFGDLS